MNWIATGFLFGLIVILFWYVRDIHTQLIETAELVLKEANILGEHAKRIKVLEKIDEEEFNRMMNEMIATLDKHELPEIDETSPILFRIKEDEKTR